MAVCGGQFLGKAYDTFAEDLVRNTLSAVAATFRDDDRLSPIKDEDGELSRLLLWQFQSHCNTDPPQQQKPLPICVLTEVYKRKVLQVSEGPPGREEKNR
eukprot:2255622-Ditylum_brightwellii.AAC.1